MSDELINTLKQFKQIDYETTESYNIIGKLLKPEYINRIVKMLLRNYSLQIKHQQKDKQQEYNELYEYINKSLNGIFNDTVHIFIDNLVD